MNAQTDDPGVLAGAYLAMAQVFSYPTTETWRRMREHGLVNDDLTLEVLESDYLAAFEVGPVPLFEGMHRGDLGRDGILEDLLRFYEFFDVKLSDTDRDFPDHLVTELEFLAWLCMREQTAQREGRDAEPFRRAARDFLVRHLAAWLPEFRRRLEATGTAYGRYGQALGELVEAHRSRLDEQPQESGATR
jgi:DMSO reductase family type II enzyme chaperone